MFLCDGISLVSSIKSLDCSFYSQDEAFLDGLCPWIPEDDEERIQKIFNILKRCMTDPNAYTNTFKPILGTLFLFLFHKHTICMYMYVNLFCLQWRNRHLKSHSKRLKVRKGWQRNRPLLFMMVAFKTTE